MAFGDNLKKVRELRGKSATDIIAGTGINKSKYYAYEKKKYEPSPEIVDQLADFLNVPREIFYKEKVTAEDLEGHKPRSFRDEIFEGDYIGLHKKVWATVEHGIYHERTRTEQLIKLLAEAMQKLGPAGT